MQKDHLKSENVMFSIIKTPYCNTNPPGTPVGHFCQFFGSVDLGAFLPRSAPSRPADFHLRPALPRPPDFHSRPAPLEKKTPPRTSLVKINALSILLANAMLMAQNDPLRIDRAMRDSEAECES